MDKTVKDGLAEFKVSINDIGNDDYLKNLMREANQLGLEGKIINEVKIKRVFGEGVTVTFKTAVHYVRRAI